MRILILVFALSAFGCSTYKSTIAPTKQFAQKGELQSAVDALNREMGVKKDGDLPEDLSGYKTLLLLERATLYQAQDRFKLAARDMVLVDQYLAWIDVSKTTAQSLGDYLYSGRKGPYRSPIPERLMVNVVNMINFLALGDFSGAKVEARRFQILLAFFDREKKSVSPRIRRLGHYLGGVAFEGASDFSNATRSYARAFHNGVRDEAFETRLIDLMRVTARTEREFDRTLSGLDGLEVRARDLGPLSTEAYREKHLKDDLVIVVQSGFVPSKRAEHIPIEKAEKLGGVTGPAGVNSVNVAKYTGGTNRSPSKVNGEAVVWNENLSEVLQQHETLVYVQTMAAAVSRAGTRQLLGNGAESGVVLASNDPTGQAIGWLTGTAVKSSMNANDRPDTRSWSLLPSNVSVVRVKSTSELVEVETAGKTETKKVMPTNRAVPKLMNFSKVR